jgi:hypothetical protein
MKLLVGAAIVIAIFSVLTCLTMCSMAGISDERAGYK